MCLVNAIPDARDEWKHLLAGFEPERAEVMARAREHIEVVIHDVLRLPDGAPPRLRVFTHEVSRVLALRERRYFHVHAARERERGAAPRRENARAVGVEGKYDVPAKPKKHEYLLVGERGSRERHGILEPRLVRQQKVHLPLHYDGKIILVDDLLCFVKTVQRPRF